MKRNTLIAAAALWLLGGCQKASPTPATTATPAPTETPAQSAESNGAVQSMSMAPADDPVEKLERQAQQAAQRAVAETADPNEINMIAYRRRLNGKAGLQMYVVFLSRSGQPIEYFVSKGKCTSSTKRLTPTHKLVDAGPNSVVVKAASEDGTHGKSSEYIYCQTADGKYKQWNGKYYASDSPIELTIKPLMLSTSGRNQQQQ